jgi:DNA-binding response OmpR family regulator
MTELLIVEDDKRLGPTLKKGLAEHGFAVSLAPTGHEALDVLARLSPDLIVLDLGLPDCDGFDLLQQIREQGYRRPVLILTARDATTDKVAGLDAGADDYLAKPFDFAELVARINALLRRSEQVEPVLQVGKISIELVMRRVEFDGIAVELTPREFDLLAYLAHYAGEVVSRDRLQTHVWREAGRFTSLDNVIDVHVSRLRRKLRAVSEADVLEVVRGSGVKLIGGL